jgi:hypothetical protein
VQLLLGDGEQGRPPSQSASIAIDTNFNDIDFNRDSNARALQDSCISRADGVISDADTVCLI